MKKQGRDDKMTYHSGSRWKNSKQVENGLGSRWKSSRWENVNHPGSKMVEWPNPRWERSNLWPGITIFCHESCWETSFIWGCFQDQKNHCLQLLHGHAASLLLLHMKLDTSFHNIFTIQTMIGYGQTGWKPVLQPCWTLSQCLLSQYWGGVLVRGRYMAQVLKVLSLWMRVHDAKCKKHTGACAEAGGRWQDGSKKHRKRMRVFTRVWMWYWIWLNFGDMRRCKSRSLLQWSSPFQLQPQRWSASVAGKGKPFQRLKL